MSTILDHLAERLGRPSLERALQRLETTPEDFAEMTGRDLAAKVQQYVDECSAYVARVRARDDQAQAAARLTESVPSEYRGAPLSALAQQGIIDAGEFTSAMQTILRVQAEEEDDPNPADDSVTALLDALQEMFGDAG